jgi:hypothetical protein
MIIAMATRSSKVLKSYDFIFIKNISEQIYHNQHSLTEKQAFLCLKILKKYISILNQIYHCDVFKFLENPVYNLPLKTVSSQHKISYIADKTIHERIKLQFPYNEEIINYIKSKRNEVYNCVWNTTDKAWYFSLDTWALKICHVLYKKYNFEYDPEFQNYFDQLNEVYNNVEKYIPLLDKIDEIYQLRNVHMRIPKIFEKNLIKSLFTARQYGILSWSNSVEKDLIDQSVDTLILHFLRHTEKNEFPVNLDEIDQKNLENLIKNLLPCVFFIPAGSELSMTIYTLEILKNTGVANTDVSVLFRLPNNTNSDFNIFVRENGLNSPLSEDTKAVLISQKIPKTFFPSADRFKTAIIYNKYHAHYTTKDFLKNFQNIIEITKKNTKLFTEKNLDWPLDV